MISILLWLSTTFLCLPSPTLAIDLPYNPVRALWSPQNSTLAYIFQPTATSASDFQLLALDTSSTLDASRLSFATLSASLPFAQKKDDRFAFTPVIDAEGSISVYTGRCDAGAKDATLWRYHVEDTSTGKGSWKEHATIEDDSDLFESLSGANYLATAISFSASLSGTSADSDIYIFGGMCPKLGSSSAESWTAAADYSNSMLSLIPREGPSDTADAAREFEVGLSKAKGPPVAAAGFSITPLLPSIQDSAGTVQSQQQSFVLLGGHTATAFVNTSNVALFSLPEQSWTFLPVQPAATEARTDLAARQPALDVDPRSGHTAILSSDGKKIVVYGGWVGDIDTPANPQLAILELGEGYGGTGDWRWTTPLMMGAGVPNGEGLYGHGALMLPGDVMMITGGYQTVAGSGPRVRRADGTTPAANTRAYFFNITSNTWTTTYTAPPTSLDRSVGSNDETSNTITSSSSKRAALGSGIVLGVAAIAGAVIVWYWYSRRMKRKRREAREKEIRELGWTAQRFGSSALGLPGIDGRGGEKSAGEWMGGSRTNAPGDATYPWGGGGLDSAAGYRDHPGRRVDHAGTDAERTGLLVEIPSPTRGLRRSLHSRGRSGERLLGYDDGSGGRRSLAGSIHPIDERDEYEQQPVFSMKTASRGLAGPDADSEVSRLTATEELVVNPPTVDPFQDPNPLGSHPVIERGSGSGSPSSPARERELEIQEWVSDWAAADALMYNNGAGRVSPDRSSPDKDRTSSTLSEKSLPASTVSALSYQPSHGGVSRSISQRSANLFSSNPFASASSRSSATVSPVFDQPGGKVNTGRSKSSTSVPRVTRHAGAPQAGSASQNARPMSTFPQLQNEGFSLLPRPGSSDDPDMPTKSRTRATGWMGSVRRALPFIGGGGTGGDRNPSPVSATAEISGPPSPTKTGEENVSRPRRTTSAATNYWQRKQGAADWDVDSRSGVGEGSRGSKRRGSEGPFAADDDDDGTEHERLNAGSRDGSGDGADEEWDVEAAVERRVVQVMFTVPRERLRVVNADGGDTDLSETGSVGKAGEAG
ncbi:MAG: hypothetical protein M1817_003959 [Caeruleum heppii]|nr:MAG: hypothetical protein M1817_003959 [Caeruleum heppii]